MTHGGDADLFAFFNKRTDHLCAGERLAGAGRTLNWQNSVVQLQGESCFLCDDIEFRFVQLRGSAREEPWLIAHQ